jgi:hypothetical protein
MKENGADHKSNQRRNWSTACGQGKPTKEKSNSTKKIAGHDAIRLSQSTLQGAHQLFALRFSTVPPLMRSRGMPL